MAAQLGYMLEGIGSSKDHRGVPEKHRDHPHADCVPKPEELLHDIAFGVMFFPDKAASFQEIARVLRRGGSYVFVVWDDWAQMEHAPLAVAADVVREMLGCEPRSLVNPPYHDEATIRADLATARFEKIDIQRVTQPARAASARAAAVATVHGSLIRTVIESKAPARLQEATDAVEQAFRARYGGGEIAGSIKGLVIAAKKPAA